MTWLLILIGGCVGMPTLLLLIAWMDSTENGKCLHENFKRITRFKWKED